MSSGTRGKYVRCGGKAGRRHKDRRRYTLPRGSACIGSKHRVRYVPEPARGNSAAACVLIRFNADRYLAARGEGRRRFPASRLFRPLPLPSFYLSIFLSVLFFFLLSLSLSLSLSVFLFSLFIHFAYRMMSTVRMLRFEVTSAMFHDGSAGSETE